MCNPKSVSTTPLSSPVFSANAALQNAELRSRFADLSVDTGGGTPREFAAYIAREIDKYNRLVKSLDIRPE